MEFITATREGMVWRFDQIPSTSVAVKDTHQNVDRIMREENSYPVHLRFQVHPDKSFTIWETYKRRTSWQR